MNVHLVNAYQHGTLQKVAEAIWAHIFDVEASKNFHMHICSEEHPDDFNRDEEMEALERLAESRRSGTHSSWCITGIPYQLYR